MFGIKKKRIDTIYIGVQLFKREISWNGTLVRTERENIPCYKEIDADTGKVLKVYGRWNGKIILFNTEAYEYDEMLLQDGWG